MKSLCTYTKSPMFSKLNINKSKLCDCTKEP